MKKIILTLPIILLSLTGFASEQPTDYLQERENPDFYVIEEQPELNFVETEFSDGDYASLWSTGSCDEHQNLSDSANLNGGVSIGTIINIGREVWKIVEAGKPQVSVKTEAAYALPKGVNCWSDLAGWEVPKVKHFNIKYKNKMGITVADFTYKISYIYGGNVNGQGLYLAGIRVVPTHLKVIWGFQFDSIAKVPNVVNRGSSKKPLAGAEIEVFWQVKSPVTDIQQTQTYFVTGDGKFTNLN